MSKFYSALMLARHVSDLIGPSSGDMFNCLFLIIDSTVLTMIYFSQFSNTQSHTTDLYHNFIIHLLHKLDQSLVQIYLLLKHIPNQHIQLVRNAPDDGPMRSETCRTNISAE